jgi:glutamine cyclotransferase
MVFITLLAVFNSSCSPVSETVDSPGSLNPTPASTCSPIPEPVDTPGSVNSTGSKEVPVHTYVIINTYPHDRSAFTQGLIYENGFLYEGTGLYQRSTVRRVELETGNVVQLYEMPEQYFGEGITIFEDRIIQLTWRAKEGFVYDKESFELLINFNYPTEGWGITHDGKQLIMSDGTANLYFLDPETFVETGRIQVSDADGPVSRLNELEYINGEIFANIWQSNRIARISPYTGEVVSWIDLRGLLSPEDKTGAVDVLNGIAYDEAGARLFVTGKLWPKLFEIEIVAL